MKRSKTSYLYINSTPNQDYFNGFGVSYFGRLGSGVSISALFGAYGVGMSASSSAPSAICHVNGSTGQNLCINITPHLDWLGQLFGVFHRSGRLIILLNALASELNTNNEEGRIEFSIPLHYYCFYHAGVATSIKYVKSFYSVINSSDTGALRKYGRYPGIKTLETQIGENIETTSNQQINLSLIIKNRNYTVDFKDINIELENIGPYLRPIDGDYTRAVDTLPHFTSGSNDHYVQILWTLEVPPEMRSQIAQSLTITPKYNITYKDGYPVPTHYPGKQLLVDGSIVTLNP